MNFSSYELPQGLKLNLGCGPVQPRGWVNIDGSNRAWLASRLNFVDRCLVKAGVLKPTEFGKQVTVLDLLKPLPYKNDSVACIYAGELWEHLEIDQAHRLTAECFRVIAPRGCIRLVVPDGVHFWRRYLEIYDEMQAKPRGERSEKPLVDHTHLYFRDICTRKSWFGSIGHKHKWQYDDLQLIRLLESHGFSQVERMEYRISRIKDIDKLERSDFLIVEGVKA